MTISNDLSTPVGKIRLLIPDTDDANAVFTDEQVAAFYTMSGSNIRLATATALEVIASNEVMISKVIRTLDLQTDGTKVSAELRARAKDLRDEAAKYDEDGDLFAGEVIDFRPDRWELGHELAPTEWIC